MKVYVLEATHWYVPSHLVKIFATKALADVEAAARVNMLRDDVNGLYDSSLKPDATAKNWDAKLQQARRLRARKLGCEVDDLEEDDADVWITEYEVIGSPAHLTGPEWDAHRWGESKKEGDVQCR